MGAIRGLGLFNYVDHLEAPGPKDHPLRTIREVVNAALDELSGTFDELYARARRHSIPLEKLLRALLLQAFYSIRSERQLMEGWRRTSAGAGRQLTGGLSRKLTTAPE